ncbi:MAG TPA: Lrp/AsnC family transcriptional regulator [Holophagaceae bacterium]|jgi:DNA-binding Lrp family transcriptional regulator|nr:Lrp/AsnC family transcriptional regulator [Holophagaceae bacterium]
MKQALDRIDRAILALLQKNARLSNKELAARVGLAPSSCLARVQKLTKDGVLRGFHAFVAPDALGIGLQALIAVKLKQHSREKVRAFLRHLVALPEVVALYHVTGAVDFQVHVAVRGTDHLRDLALDAFTVRSEVESIQTSLLFETKWKDSWPDYGA